MAKGGTTQRGYGWAHRRAREAALNRLTDGQPCARCGQPMYRAEAKHLDLDHTDDRQAYRGLAHRTCNRRAGQAKAQARQRARSASSKPAVNSRAW